VADPMPRSISPMLVQLAAELPRNQDAWAFEPKWDGFRAIVYVSGGRVRVSSRNGGDFTGHLPELQLLAAELRDRQVVLDGELVALRPDGVPSFELLQERMGLERRTSREPIGVMFMAFDVLHVDGRSLVDAPYLERRRALEGLELSGDHWSTPPFSTGQGDALFEASCRLGLEGVVGKRLTSRYEPGRRSGAWIKVKRRRRQELVIGGWIPGVGNRTGRIGGLLVGYYQEGKLVYGGSVGTGLTDAMLAQLQALLDPLACERNVFDGGELPPWELRFVEPRLVCEVEFLEWTRRSGQLRHPSFRGLRRDKSAIEVVREDVADYR
jgi:bifunctional non-homologous end joining protein LigD